LHFRTRRHFKYKIPQFAARIIGMTIEKVHKFLVR
jgi:hypothetical protein